MRRQALTALVLLLSAAPRAGAQEAPAPPPPDYTESFAGPLDGRWFGAVTTPVPGGVATGLRVDAGTRPTLTGLVNPRTLHFDLYPAVVGQPAAVRVERSCDAGNSWSFSTDLPVSASPTPAAIPLDVVGNCQVRWGPAPASAGAAVLANLSYYRLTDEQVAQISRQTEITERAVMVFSSQNQQTAATSLRSVGAEALLASDHLAEIASDAYLFASMNQFGSAVGKRAELLNPLAYSTFTSLVDAIKPAADPVMRMHLEEERSALQGIITGVVNMATGNWVGAATEVTRLVPQLHGFRRNFQTVLAMVTSNPARMRDVYRQGPLAEVFAAANRNPEAAAVSLYVRSNDLLSGMATESEALATSLDSAVALAGRNAALAARAEQHLAYLAEFAGMGGQARAYRIAVRETNRGGGTPAERALVESFRQRFRARIEEAARSPQVAALDNTRQALHAVLFDMAAIDRERRALIAEQKSFLTSQITYLCSLRPRSTDRAVVTEWNHKVAAAVTQMRAAQQSFYQAVANEEAPRPQACPNQPSVVRPVGR